MRWNTGAVSVATAWAMAVPTAALAEGPAFDCRTVQAEVEKLVCSDAALASLDRRLDEVYRSALAQATGPMAYQLRQEQRGWDKGRNECWKARGQETWITATWTVNTMRGCVEAQYRLRTSELQAVWRLLQPTTQTFFCQGQPANEVVANFFDTDPPTLRLERGDQTRTLWRVGTASAGRYEGQNVGLVHQDGSLTLNWLDTRSGQAEEWQCRAR